MTNYTLKVRPGFEPPNVEGITVNPIPCTWFMFLWHDDDFRRTIDWRYHMSWESIDKLGIDKIMDMMFDHLIDETMMEPW